MNVYGVTNKSIQFFLNLFKFNSIFKNSNKPISSKYRTNIQFKEQDREWAKIHFMNRYSQ